MKYSEIQTKLQTLTNNDIKLSQIADVLGVSRQNMDFRVKKGKGDIPKEELELLQEAFGVSLFEETVTLDYIHINPSCGHGTFVLDEPDVTPVKLGTRIIQDVLHVQNPNTLKVIRAAGDSMVPTIHDGDMCIVDTSRTDYMNGGVFLLTINNDWYVKRIRKRMSGELDIISDNPRYQVETFKPNTDIDIYIKGRIIHNLSSLL